MTRKLVGGLAAGAVLTLAAAAAYGSGRTAAPGVQVAVSRERGTQSETTIALNPVNDQILLAGSNSHRDLKVHAYSSIDGGASWTRTVLPHASGTVLSADPVAAIDRTGREYFAYIGAHPVRRSVAIDLVVAERPDPAGPWRAVSVAPEGNGFDDKPALAVDNSAASPHANRVYAVWSRVVGSDRARIAISHSDDAGATWSAPARVDDPPTTFSSYPTIAIAADGSVYVAWWNALDRGVFVDRSTDGGQTFGRDALVDPIAGRSTCSPPGVRIPAQPTNCVRPNPVVSVDTSGGPLTGRVYLTYGDTGGGRKEQDVFVAAFDPALAPLVRRRMVNPRDARGLADQFWPASAVDQTTGRLWVCFYDTTGDRRRRRAFYSCTLSNDGGATWAATLRVASVGSNETVRGADTGRSRFGREYGDYEGLAVANGVAHPVWTDTRNLKRLKEEVYTTAVVETSFLPR